MTSTDLVNQCFKVCSWNPLTMVKSLLLNSSLLKIRIPALAFNCSYASPVINKIRNPLTVCGFHLHLRIPPTFCEIHLQLWSPEQLAIFACSGNRDTANVPTKFNCTLNSRKFCFWNPHTFWNMFKDFFLESRNIQTKFCAYPGHNFCLVMRFAGFLKVMAKELYFLQRAIPS